MLHFCHYGYLDYTEPDVQNSSSNLFGNRSTNEIYVVDAATRTCTFRGKLPRFFFNPITAKTLVHLQLNLSSRFSPIHWP